MIAGVTLEQSWVKIKLPTKLQYLTLVEEWILMKSSTSCC